MWIQAHNGEFKEPNRFVAVCFILMEKFKYPPTNSKALDPSCLHESSMRKSIRIYTSGVEGVRCIYLCGGLVAGKGTHNKAFVFWWARLRIKTQFPNQQINFTSAVISEDDNVNFTSAVDDAILLFIYTCSGITVQNWRLVVGDPRSFRKPPILLFNILSTSTDRSILPNVLQKTRNAPACLQQRQQTGMDINTTSQTIDPPTAQKSECVEYLSLMYS